MKRKYLIENLEDLLSDEFEPKEIMYKRKKELIEMIISAAYYYKHNY